MNQSLLTFLARPFALDRRSCALFRILLALVVLGDLYNRIDLLEAHYTDEGPFSRIFYPYFRDEMWDFAKYFHGFSGSYSWQVFCFSLHALCTIPLLLGWKSRFFAVVQWYMQASLANYCPIVRSGADQVFAFASFFAMFLPLGDHFSVDAALKFARRLSFDEESAQVKVRSPKPPRYTSAVTVAYLTQVSLMYSINNLVKTGPAWTETDSATRFSLELEFFKTSYTWVFKEMPELLYIMGFFVLRWELWGPLCLYQPFLTDQLRLVGTIGFSMMHLAFGMALRLGEFIFIPQAALSALLPSYFWDDIVFPILRFECEQQPRHRNSRAVLELCHQSPLLWPLAGLYTFLYAKREAAAVRHLASCLSAAAAGLARIPTAGKRRKALVARLQPMTRAYFLYLALVLVVWNLHNLREGKEHWSHQVALLPLNLGIIGSASLWQWWNMFSPQPPASVFWYVAEFSRVSGDNVELVRNGGMYSWEPAPVSYNPPRSMHQGMRSHRNFKYWENGILRLPATRPQLGGYICRNYNKRHPENPIMVGELTFLQQPIIFQSAVKPYADRQSFQLWDCRDWMPELRTKFPSYRPQRIYSNYINQSHMDL